jgi:hypothetical protein
MMAAVGFERETHKREKEIERNVPTVPTKTTGVSSYLGQIILDKLFNFRVTMRQRKFRKGFIINICSSSSS